MKYLSAFILVAVLSCTVTAQQDANAFGSSSQSNDYYDVPEECTVQLIQDIELPALESGQLTQILVKPGDRVVPDSHVAQMDDTRAQRLKEEATHKHQIADDQANDSTQVNTAYKRYELAFAEHTKMEKLRKTGSMSDQQAERAKVSAEIAYYEYHGAKKTKQLAGLEAAAEMVALQAAGDSIRRHALKSNIDGIVYEVLKDPGEWVTAGETVMKIAQMDRLRIPAIIEGNLYDPHQIADRKVTATVTLANNQKVEFEGKIVSVGIKKRMGNLYKVFAEIDNRLVKNSDHHWILHPGAEVRVRIHLNQPAIKSASTIPPATVEFKK